MYDLVIIGSGPAGHTAALLAAKHGMSVALIEKGKDMLGGVCLNEGCIPLKGLLHYSASGIKDLSKTKNNVMQKISVLRAGLKFRLDRSKVEYVNAEAKVAGPGKVAAGGKTYEAKYILIAAGSSPKRLFNNPVVLSPDIIFRLDKAPAKALIIGGGVIGCEYASLLSNMGTSVDIVEAMDSILFIEDQSGVRMLAREFRKKNITLYEKSTIASVSQAGEAVIKTGSSEIKLKYDLIVEATGRQPNTGNMGLKEAGIRLNAGGFIEVDAHMETNVPGIFAAGDCIPTPMLAYTASKEAETAVEYMATGKAEPVDYVSCPKLVFSFPQLGSAGLSEEKAKEKKIDFKAYKYFFKAVGKAVVEDMDTGFIKLLVDRKTDKIIGASAVGAEIVDTINELSIIIRNGITAGQVRRTMHIHPSYSEIIVEALNFGE